MKKDHGAAFDDHNKTFDDDTIAKWTKMVEDWDTDLTKPNPYEEPQVCEYNKYSGRMTSFLYNPKALNLAEVRLELSKEEAEDAARGVEQGHETTPSKFLIQGLELEDQQYVVK